MRIEPVWVQAEIGGDVSRAPLTSSPATASIGPLEVQVDRSPFPTIAWTVANASDRPVRVRSVAVVFAVVDAVEPVRLFRHGYQSWSPTGVATLGLDRDPSTIADFEFLQAAHHADQRRAPDGELRSELVTLLRDADVRGEGQPILVGFDGGHEHDGTLRLRRDEAGGITLAAEAFLGDVELQPGEARELHGIVVDDTGDGAPAALDRWATTVGRRHGGRTAAPYQVGWCSWYHYFHDVTEADLRANLARAADWPFDVFQLDDGFQSAIGDWLTTNDRFPSAIDAIAAAIAAEGRTPGLWIAPFLAAPDSQVAREHPDWLAGHVGSGGEVVPLRGWWNPPWGGGDDGFMRALDTSHPEVLDHLEQVARALVDAGFPYLKLDFTFAPSHDGVWHDPGMTPAQRVRAGYDAVRRGAGDDAFLLGCGAPIGHVLGVVDGNRIGQDVAPLWDLGPDAEVIPGYLGTQPATQFAYGNTVARSFLHRRFWLNDPDCLMLRAESTDLSPEAARTWAHTVAVSGGMALVSDDLALLGDDAKTLLDDVVAIGREVDAAATGGAAPRCADLLDHAVPHRLAAAGYELTVDPATAVSTLRRP
jgi:alpha-galactosidase